MDGTGVWAARFRAAVAAGIPVVVEDVELLAEPLLRLIAEHVDAGARVVLTGPPIAGLGAAHRHLALRCPGRVELPALRDRRSEVPALAAAMLRAATGGAARFTPAASARLAELDWPGNLRELHHVVETTAAHRSAGDVLLTDLPPAYRAAPAGARLSPWERADHDAILAALQATGGNKVAAARYLGISRGTLYNRIRALRIAV